jgi:hypothetical protein
MGMPPRAPPNLAGHRVEAIGESRVEKLEEFEWLPANQAVLNL